jgi:probable HAF family extracellular repeat protein
VVGYSAVDSSAVNFHAFLWQNGTMQDLGLPPGAIHSWAFAIDSTGRVLLGSENSRLEQSYWVWKNGLFTQLAGLGSVAFTEGSSAGSIASVGSGAIAASVCPTSSGSVMACIWNLP